MVDYFKEKIGRLVNLRAYISHCQFKIIIWLIQFFFFLLLVDNQLLNIALKEMLLLLGLNLIIVVHHWKYKETNSILWLLSVVLDVYFVSILIRYSGGLESPFVIAYAVLLVEIGVRRQKLWEVITVGLIGHLGYVMSLYFYYYNFNFYFTAQFWTHSILLGITFINVAAVTRILNNQNSKLREINKELEEIAITDRVTKLYNFRYFHQQLEEKIKLVEKNGISLVLILIDLDDFKEYNNYVGTQKGDEALYQVGEILQEIVTEDDIVTRLGGDKFGVILTETGEQEGEEIAVEIRNQIHDHKFDWEENLPFGVLTASLGMAVYSDDLNSREDLINRAEEALHKVKLSHKNGVRTYDSIFNDLEQELNEESDIVNTLQVLLTVINARDRYTYGHCERVVQYALAIGKELGLNDTRQRLLKYGAFLHDIGKIEIGREILNKNGRLNPSEWELVKQHSVFGVDIVKSIDSLSGTIPIIKHHHEKYDGSGYPDGLEGKKIPLMARILAVADSFDAMVTNRPYQAGMTKEEAIKELKKCTGSQFDPRIVDAFLEVVHDVYEEISLRGAS